MPGLVFRDVDRYWQGNDYKDIPARPAKGDKPARPAESHHVSMTSVAVETEPPFALIYMTHMNIDFDGAGNAYGPDNLEPLDYLVNAGLPTPTNQVDRAGMIRAPDGARVKVDPRQPDKQGYLPVIQQAGPFAGYDVSTTSKRKPDPDASTSQYQQSYYLDSASVAYCALSSGIRRVGVGGVDLGIAIRLDTFKSASFNFLEGEGSDSNAVGECSYKVFLDTGGTPKRKGDPWPNNNFPTCFVVFPGSKYCPLLKLPFVDNPSDFATFIALQGQVDAAVRGTSGLARFNDWVAKGRTSTPASYDAIFPR